MKSNIQPVKLIRVTTSFCVIDEQMGNEREDKIRQKKLLIRIVLTWKKGQR